MKQPHICLDETLGVRYAILPGDPARLDRVAAQLESVRELAYNREFRSLTGTYKGVPVLAVSTGIGGSSARDLRGRTAQHRHNRRHPHRLLRGLAKRHCAGRSDSWLRCDPRRWGFKGLCPSGIPGGRRLSAAWLVRGRRKGDRLSVSCRHHPQPREFLSRGKRRGECLLVAQGARWARIWSPPRCLPSAVCAG